MPSAKLGPLTQGIRQCQNCYKEEPEVRIQSCAKCRLSHYCSRECQVADWPGHKGRCKLNQDTKAQLKDAEFAITTSEDRPEHSVRAPVTQTGLPAIISTLNPRDTERKLKKWIQIYRPIIQVSVTHALTLQSTPDLCMTHLLAISLIPNPSFFSSKSDNDIARAFLVESVNTHSLSDVGEGFAGKGHQPDEIFSAAKSRAIREKGGIGIALTSISVPAAGLTHITPFMIPFMLTEAECPWNYEWEMQLKESVARGIVI